MVTLFFVLLVFFTQSYLLLLIQTVQYDRALSTLRIHTLQDEQFAMSVFLHISSILAQNQKDEMTGEVALIIRERKGERASKCYATIKHLNKKQYQIIITFIHQNNKRKLYEGTILITENNFSIVSFKIVSFKNDIST